MTCASCMRADFASSLRCQWCGTHLAEASPAAQTVPGGLAAATMAPGTTGSPPLDVGDKPKKKLKSTLGTIFASIAVLLGKFKSLAVALKFGKLTTTLVSMLVSIGFYALLFGWSFAAGFVILIFVHEMGHVIALKRRKIPIEGMFFVPFLGAAVSFKKRPPDPAVNAEISWAGPFAGLLGGLVCAALFYRTGNIYWAALAHITFLINLLNLAPSVPLDGGWIVRAINPKWSLAGSVIGIALGLYLHYTILAVLSVLGALNAYNTMKAGDDDLDLKPAVPPVAPAVRTRVTVAYLSLILVLGVAMAESTHVLDQDRARRDSERTGIAP